MDLDCSPSEPVMKTARGQSPLLLVGSVMTTRAAPFHSSLSSFFFRFSFLHFTVFNLHLLNLKLRNNGLIHLFYFILFLFYLCFVCEDV
ncbi:hypothetical protein Lalb_Chr14g0376061 [Lupinus albus]|uniref:Uncharacterized protein n=1 Tax=Lupinus albus TaxID=3870 RepID=A0A6A4PGT8_LUPAL|nr:hypothetical protein Lalb_Chr14g0376061 [Lupinus albus]